MSRPNSSLTTYIAAGHPQKVEKVKIRSYDDSDQSSFDDLTPKEVLVASQRGYRKEAVVPVVAVSLCHKLLLGK